jgi:hypothetical protein
MSKTFPLPNTKVKQCPHMLASGGPNVIAHYIPRSPLVRPLNVPHQLQPSTLIHIPSQVLLYISLDAFTQPADSK